MTDHILFNSTGSFPTELDSFVVANTILLPRSQVHINVTEPCAIKAVDQALRTDRLLGVVQPHPDQEDEVFSSGTLGKLTTFIERNPGHYTVLLTGICRFEVKQQLAQHKGYRRFQVDYQRYGFDGFEETILVEDREKLLALLKGYFTLPEMYGSIEDLEKVSDEDLLTSLTMLYPLKPEEKQALLESPTAQNRCELITAMIELAALQGDNKDFTTH